MSGCHRIKTNDPKEYLNSKSRHTSNGCIEFTGVIGYYGYGRIDRTKWNRIYNVSRAHMLSYIVYKGDYDRSLDVCHKCDNPKCINPDHLFTGSRKENMRDCSNKNRCSKAQAKISEEQALDIRFSDLSTKELATKYGLSKSNINLIKSGKTWRLASSGLHY